MDLIGIVSFLVQVALVVPMGLALVVGNADQREENEKMAAERLLQHQPRRSVWSSGS